MFLKTKTAAEFATMRSRFEAEQRTIEAKLKVAKEALAAAPFEDKDTAAASLEVRRLEDALETAKAQAREADRRHVAVQVVENDAAMKKMAKEEQQLMADTAKAVAVIRANMARQIELERSFKTMAEFNRQHVPIEQRGDVLQSPIRAAWHCYKRVCDVRATNPYGADQRRVMQAEVANFVNFGALTVSSDFRDRDIGEFFDVVAKLPVESCKASSPAPVNLFESPAPNAQQHDQVRADRARTGKVAPMSPRDTVYFDPSERFV